MFVQHYSLKSATIILDLYLQCSFNQYVLHNWSHVCSIAYVKALIGTVGCSWWVEITHAVEVLYNSGDGALALGSQINLPLGTPSLIPVNLNLCLWFDFDFSHKFNFGFSHNLIGRLGLFFVTEEQLNFALSSQLQS